ncbi:putative UDP-rhamnose:rhamnosyltransferase 1 [Camellia lanceoleosa]|uniref:UDP-rhamnose:rhamnosyltransferase 1 n=1 Tax=Camellia lanceoleosa TaxID=1840588 RepID=A0ACC0IDN9_9ERIC|nr:putative UDP-rhamnose:rhamnosyltransferase 1 [Camellia lanceoleosa]
MERAIHAALVPFVAFGHLIPFYELSIALAKAGIHVSFISTRNNIQRLPQLPPHLSSLITFVPLSWSTVGSNLLPEGIEATADILPDNFEHLMTAFDLLKHPFKQFVIEQSPDWIISDFVSYWTVDVANECHIPLVIFSTFSAATNVFFGPPEYLSGNGQRRLRSSPWWVSFRSSVHYRRYEAIGAIAGLYTNASGISGAERVARTLDGCRAVAIRSCREFEGEYFDLFGKIMGNKRVIPTGVLLPEKPNKTPIPAAHNGEWSKIFEWLDEQKPKSVVFVGFGSEFKFSRDQVYEIASRLESSELPFLWALRKPSWASDDLDTMPPDFFRRTSGGGKVYIGWAPQIEILLHPSIGGSSVHAGWGSVVESLRFGHCMVVLPLTADQPLNARLLVEKGLAIEVERGEDGSFCWNNIALCLRKSMASKEGDEMRIRVEKAAAIFRNQKLQNQYVDEFVEYLKNGK